MDLDNFLRIRLQEPLPGIDVQMKMAPPIRLRNEFIPPDARLSAVMMLLYRHEGSWRLPLMRRTEDGRVHGGQISLPGGKHDPGDPDFRYTALRETEEEFGLSRHDIDVLGGLTEIYIPPSRFLVYPFLGILPERPHFQPAPREVAEIIEVELHQFLDDSRREWHEVMASAGGKIQTPGYRVNEGILIWGGTAMMIAELAALVQEWQDHPSRSNTPTQRR